MPLQLFDPSAAQPDDAAPRTVADVIRLYLTHTQRDQHPRTYADRQRVLLAFAAEHGNLLLGECRAHHLRLWVDSHEEWASDWTRKRVISTVKTAFAWAGKMGFLAPPINPFSSVTQRAGERGQPMRPEHFRALLRATSATFRRLLIFLAFSGARPGEASAALFDQVDRERAILVLTKHKTARTRRDRKPRVIVLHPVLLKLVDWLWRHRMPWQKHLFVNARGNPWTRAALALRMMRLRERTGVPAEAKLKGLRHKFITDALVRGVDLVAVSRLAGHTDVKTTQIYAHIEGELSYLQGALEKAVATKHGAPPRE